MAVETATNINQLDPLLPAASDGKSEGDNHIRLVKATLKTTFNGITGISISPVSNSDEVLATTSQVASAISLAKASIADGAELASNKDATGGYAGLTLFKLNLKNAANTFTNFLTNATTAVRTWTFPDKSGTVALIEDFAAPPAIGNTTAAAVSATNLAYTGTLTGGTGVVNLGSAQFYKDAAGNVGIGITPSARNNTRLQIKDGIGFPATQVPSSDVNTLDDYEEGTWTPGQGSGLTVVGTFSSSGNYTKIGNVITVSGKLQGDTSVAAAAGLELVTGLPFSTGKKYFIGCCMNTTGSVSSRNFVDVAIVYTIEALAATPVIYFSLTYEI